MRFLSFSECVNWCSERGISTPTGDHSHAPAIEEPEFHFADLPYDIDSGRKVACAEHLYSLVEPSPETLLWLTAWSVWPSSQHMPLFDRFRQSLGEFRPLIEAPGHLVTAADADDARSIIAVSLLFLWDCFGISASGREAFKVSHDEYCWFASRDSENAARLSKQFCSPRPVGCGEASRAGSPP
jgi:hypothetical protein